MKLNELADRLENPILQVWNAIAPDLDALDPDLDNEGAIEACIDAGRIEMFANDAEGDKLLSAACVEHGYAVVLKTLSDKINLV